MDEVFDYDAIVNACAKMKPIPPPHRVIKTDTHVWGENEDGEIVGFIATRECYEAMMKDMEALK